VLDVLWPDEPEQMSRPRLREVLHRLRRAAPLVVREGETLCFVEGIRLDLPEAERVVALAVGRGPGRDLEQVASALTAVPLPGDYDDHAEEARRRARGARLAALDLLAKAAAARGQLDEAARWWTEAVRADPVDESRLARAARALLDGDRALDALRVLAAGRDGLADLDLPLSAAVEALADQAAQAARRL
jgi:DNA-binding SARP family transcriptional activator